MSTKALNLKSPFLKFTKVWRPLNVVQEYIYITADSCKLTKKIQRDQGPCKLDQEHLVCWLIGWLAGYTCITPSCLRRGTGGDRDPRRWGKRETIPYTTLSPPE